MVVKVDYYCYVATKKNYCGENRQNAENPVFAYKMAYREWTIKRKYGGDFSHRIGLTRRIMKVCKRIPQFRLSNVGNLALCFFAIEISTLCIVLRAKRSSLRDSPSIFTYISRWHPNRIIAHTAAEGVLTSGPRCPPATGAAGFELPPTRHQKAQPLTAILR